MRIKLNNRGMGLLSILFALVIIGLMYYFTMKPKATGAAKDGYLKQSGIDASNYKSTVDSTKKVLNDAVKTRSEQAEGL